MQKYINTYIISRFKSFKEEEEAAWLDVHDFIEVNGAHNLDLYLIEECKILNFLWKFFEYHLLNIDGGYYGHINVNFINVSDQLFHPKSYEGLSMVQERLRSLSQKSASVMSEDEHKFLLTCWVRGFCDLEIFAAPMDFLCSGKNKMTYHLETFFYSDLENDVSMYALTDGLYYRVGSSVNPLFLSDCSRKSADYDALVNPIKYQINNAAHPS